MDEKTVDIVLGIHSNVYPENETPGVGHCWVSVDKNGQVETYGSFPKNDPDVRDHGQEKGWNESGTSVQKNVEINSDMQSVSQKFYELTEDQQGVLDQLLNEPHEWSHRSDNCASWAAKVYAEVTGERVSPEHDFPDRVDPQIIHTVDAPQGVSKSIQELEQEKSQGVMENQTDNKPTVKAVDTANAEIVAADPVTFSGQMTTDEFTLKKQHSDHFASHSSDQEKEETESEVSDHSSVEVDERMEAALNRQAYVRSLSEQQAEKENEGR